MKKLPFTGMVATNKNGVGRRFEMLFKEIKKAATKWAMSPQAMKIMTNPNVQKAMMKVLQMPGTVRKEVQDRTSKFAQYADLVTRKDIQNVNRSVREMERELRRLKKQVEAERERLEAATAAREASGGGNGAATADSGAKAPAEKTAKKSVKIGKKAVKVVKKAKADAPAADAPTETAKKTVKVKKTVKIKKKD